MLEYLPYACMGLWRDSWRDGRHLAQRPLCARAQRLYSGFTAVIEPIASCSAPVIHWQWKSCACRQSSHAASNTPFNHPQTGHHVPPSQLPPAPSPCSNVHVCKNSTPTHVPFRPFSASSVPLKPSFFLQDMHTYTHTLTRMSTPENANSIPFARVCLGLATPTELRLAAPLQEAPNLELKLDPPPLRAPLSRPLVNKAQCSAKRRKQASRSQSCLNLPNVLFFPFPSRSALFAPLLLHCHPITSKSLILD